MRVERRSTLMAVDTHWGSPPSALTLEENEAHIWRARLDRDATFLRRAETTLAGDERTRAARFHFARDRDRFVASHAILRTILSRYIGRAEDALEFSYEPAGKPRLRLLDGQERLRFNLSHSQDLAVYG